MTPSPGTERAGAAGCVSRVVVAPADLASVSSRGDARLSKSPSFFPPARHLFDRPTLPSVPASPRPLRQAVDNQPHDEEVALDDSSVSEDSSAEIENEVRLGRVVVVVVVAVPARC